VIPPFSCIGPDNELHSEFTGELLAIKNFNARHDMKKLAPINGLAHKRLFPAPWNDVMYVMHSFEHPLYGRYITPRVDMQLALEDPGQDRAAARLTARDRSGGG
jgi:hypothetical protein